jgi:hypothetical protein
MRGGTFPRAGVLLDQAGTEPVGRQFLPQTSEAPRVEPTTCLG